jgi:RNA polymerase subunit RPABC4/transcription elongation factor Spt4
VTNTEELTAEAPRTRICNTCSVEINSASQHCPYCGARQFRHQSIIGWRGLIACVIAVALAVFVTRLVVQASNNGTTFAAYRSADLVSLVPSGYTDELLAGPHGTAIAGFADPSQTADSVTIQASSPAGGTPHARVLAVAAKLRDTPGVQLGLVYAVTLPGATAGSAWEVLYQLSGADYAVLEYDACDRAVGVKLTLSATSIGLLGELEQTVPQSAQPICDGPDFSDRDRADTSVPLRSSSGT